MSIAVLFTIAKCWKQPKCPSVDEWIKRLWYNLTIASGEWGGDSEERGLQELLLGRMDKIKGEGGGGGGKWVQLGWGGGMGRKGIQL